jgi:hypothetical protein
MKAVAPGNEVALQSRPLAGGRERDGRALRGDPVDLHVRYAEEDLTARREARRDEVLDHLLLAVNRDGAVGDELVEGNAMRRPAESQLDPAMDHALAHQALAHIRRAERVDGALLEHACAHSLLDVIAARPLEHDRMDSAAMQQVRQQEPRRPGADDADLGLHAVILRQGRGAWLRSA